MNKPTFKEDFDKSGISKEVRIEILNEVYGDLSNGAYFAVAQEFGLEPKDLIDQETGG